jgi:hypothetical protein
MHAVQRQYVRSEKGLNRVDPQEGGEQAADRGQVGDRPGRRGRAPPARSDRRTARGAARGQTERDDGEEEADGQDAGGVLEGVEHPAAGTPLIGREAVHHGTGVGGGEQAERQSDQQEQQGEQGIGEVHGEGLQPEEGEAAPDQTRGGEGARPVPVGQLAGQRTGDEEPHGERDHVDARPQRRPRSCSRGGAARSPGAR